MALNLADLVLAQVSCAALGSEPIIFAFLVLDPQELLQVLIKNTLEISNKLWQRNASRTIEVNRVKYFLCSLVIHAFSLHVFEKFVDFIN